MRRPWEEHEILRHALARIDVSNLKLHGIRLEQQSHHDFPGFVGHVSAPDRDSGSPIEVQMRRQVYIPGAEDQLNRLIFCAVREMVLHEVAEQFLVDGKRIYDPHKKST